MNQADQTECEEEERTSITGRIHFKSSARAFSYKPNDSANFIGNKKTKKYLTKFNKIS